uniref:Uncharacterized protein n=1 Tax=Anguilla anguilla TaxID=7936 RepID=A0A0E9PXG4_ANGAN
MSQLISDQLM